MTPAQWMQMNMGLARLAYEAQSVMAWRMMGMAGLIPASKGENDRMVREKAPAFARAMIAGSTAAMAGKRPDQIVAASLAPLTRTARANRKRLTRT